MEVKKILLVLSTVGVTLFTALLLNHAAKESGFNIISITIVFTVILINFIKFLVWGVIYKKYDLSEAYPLTALFFPLIYFVAVLKEEASFNISKLFGVVLILIGVYIINKKK